jgi:hypothetical protein
VFEKHDARGRTSKKNAQKAQGEMNAMTMFPDCRNDDFYNEDFLPDGDKCVVSGFDIAAEAVETCFHNIEADDLCGPLGDNKVVKSLVTFVKEFFRNELKEWLESERNMMITSMLDGIEEEEFTELRARALKEHPSKKYYDSRKFMCTGKKEFRRE